MRASGKFLHCPTQIREEINEVLGSSARLYLGGSVVPGAFEVFPMLYTTDLRTHSCLIEDVTGVDVTSTVSSLYEILAFHLPKFVVFRVDDEVDSVTLFIEASHGDEPVSILHLMDAASVCFVPPFSTERTKESC